MVQEKLEIILNQVGSCENLRNFEVRPHIDAIRGDGFLSEFYTGDVIDKDTGSKIQLYIKLPSTNFETMCFWAFRNEYRFYSNILPELNKFQVKKGVTLFKNIPKFYCGNDQLNDAYIALENLRIQNFVLYDKTQYMNKDHLRAVFDMYGKFHALCFAYKDQHVEKYLECMEPLDDLFASKEKSQFFQGINISFKQAYKVIEDIDTEIAKKIKPYVENLEEVYKNACRYDGKYSAITHGDCWSNNMLFKYMENGKLEDIKFIDFQFCRVSTPIHDLSYFFYSGASKEDFDQLEEYLELYHKSFSKYCKELGSDPEKLLPLSVLKSEWKKHSLFGILIGIMLWQIKLMQKDVIDDFTTGRTKEEIHKTLQSIWEGDDFKKNTSNILIHAVEYGIL